MNENKHTYPGSPLWRLQYLLLLLFAVLFLTVTGCWRDSLPGKRQLKFNFHSASQAGNDAIREIELFVFDDQQQLINRATGTIGETISLDCPSTRSLHCIAWGNSNDKSLRLPALQAGDLLDGAYLALTPLSSVKAETQYLNTPPDLFRGAIDTGNKTIARGASFTMEMRPATASIHITISGLSRATGTTDGNYTVEVSRTAARIDFEGTTGGTAVHQVTGSFNSQKEYIVPSFRVFPPPDGKGIKIAVFHNGKLLKEFTQTSNRQPLVPVAGQELMLPIAFNADGSAEIKPPGWVSSDVDVTYQ